MASASAFAGATPAKLGVAYVPPLAVVAPIGMPVEPACVAATCASCRAFCADEASQMPIGIIVPTARPMNSTSSLSATFDRLGVGTIVVGLCRQAV